MSEYSIANRQITHEYTFVPLEDAVEKGTAMPKKQRRKRRQDETLQRNVVISSFAPRVSVSVKGGKGPEPQIEGRPWLELRGRVTEPIRDTYDVVFRLWADPDKRVGPARPVAVAHVTGIRPQVEVIASCAPAEFGYIWSLALSGHLTHAYLSLTKPHYNSASVFYLSFSNALEE